MSDIFISYVEEDADVVEPLAQGLIEAGYSCWYYQRSSLPGASYLQQISDALSQAKVVLLVLSPQTLDSFQVDKEISFAHDCNKPFLPVTRDLAWGDFQQRRPTWRLAVGTSVAIPIPRDGVIAILPRVIEGLKGLRMPAPAPLPGVAPLVQEAVSVSTSLPSLATSAPAINSLDPSASASDLRPALTFPAKGPGLLPTRTGFVGRSSELELLKQYCDAVSQSRGGRLVFISGEPGVGKTRLAQEAGLYAWTQGGLFFEGTYLRDGTAPYGPWIDMLRSGLSHLSPEMITPVLSLYGAELVQLCPELEPRFGPFPTAARSAEEQRRRLFDGLAEFVTVLARYKPLVLLFNDLQWAPDLAVLGHVTRRLGKERVLLIGTYREQEFKEQPALMQEWAELNRARLAAQLSLHPLTDDESIKLVELYFGAEPSKQLGSLLHLRTRGNAFFLEEILRSLVETGAVAAGPSGWHVIDPSRLAIPDTVRVVVEERVRRLGEEARELLIQAAVLGQEFSFPVLQEMAGYSENQLLDLLERAVTARLLVDRSVADEERFAFADDQLQEVLYSSIPALRRRRMHLKAGQTIEAAYADRLDQHLEELAYHFRAANDVRKARDYAIRAAERAYSLFLWEQAISHFERAAELLDREDDLTTRAYVLERLVDLDTVQGRPGLRNVQQALELYLKLGDRVKAARLYSQLGGRWHSGMAGETDWEQAMVHAEAAVDLLASEPDSVEKAFALGRLNLALICGRLDLQRALRQVKVELEIAEHLNDPDQIAYAYAFLAGALAFLGELTQAQDFAERSWSTALEGDDIYIRGVAIVWPVLVWPWQNDRHWVQQWLGRHAEYRERGQAERHDRPAAGLSACIAALAGRPAEAQVALQQFETLVMRRPTNYPFWDYFAAMAEHVVGNRDRAGSLFGRALQVSESAHARALFVQASYWYGRFLVATGELVEAERVLRAGLDVAVEYDSRVHEVAMLPWLAEVYVHTNRLGDAERCLDRAQVILAQPQPWRELAAPVSRAEGVLAAARRDWPRAENKFCSALDAECAYGFPYDEANVLVPWAELYFQRNKPGDRERGLEKLDQALAIFEQCQAKQDIERVLSRRSEIAS